MFLLGFLTNKVKPFISEIRIYQQKNHSLLLDTTDTVAIGAIAIYPSINLILIG